MSSGPHAVAPRATWRLLVSELSDGATNMATDEAIMTAVAQGTAPPTLRFYGWSPPCVSVGYAQGLRSEIDLVACKALGYQWVRRPTGGRAVLHIDELTYSVTAPQREPRVAGDIVTSYRRLSRGLVEGLRVLGCSAAQAGYQQGANTTEKSAACFDVPSHYEVTASGRKLVGSAQVRRRGVVLQHGALPLYGDVTRLAQVLTLEESERQELRLKLALWAITLDEAVGRPVPFAEAVEALIAGFDSALNLDLQPGELLSQELALVADLVGRYRGDEWTYAR